MIILGIETSCDETAISLVRGAGGLIRPHFDVLGHVVSSQTKVHAPWGGVVPMLAKREHGKNLIPVFKKALQKAQFLKQTNGASAKVPDSKNDFDKLRIEKILKREPELFDQFLKFIPTIVPPKKIDLIAVTCGPGLEPALWTGLNFARALAYVWKKPLIPINHMEGHIYSVLISRSVLEFPALSLLISGGHTEIVLIRDWLKARLLGSTRDDAVGEAFDKVARLLDLPYPGGANLSRLATTATKPSVVRLPRPMIISPDFDFSFSGLKTAVLYRVSDLKKQNLFNADARATLAADFEQAVIDILLAKTSRAIKEYKPKTLIVAGGVSANQPLRQQFAKYFKRENLKVKLLFPSLKLTGDNATMIAVAGYLRSIKKQIPKTNKFKIPPTIKARGNLALG